MNETITVIIGTISGFIVAFFAEPVKNYFQNKAKLRNLRIALYKELVHNYSILKRFRSLNSDSAIPTEEFLARHALRTECYKNAIQNELSFFYQLDEANEINSLQGTLMGQLLNLSRDFKDFTGEATRKVISATFMDLSKTFQELFTTRLYDDTLNGKILMNLVSTPEYQEIMRRGKEFSQKHRESEKLPIR